MTSVSQGAPELAAAVPPEARRLGRPRSDQVEKAILDAVLGLFGEGCTYDGLSMELIASAAGVGKATIYRRWPNKEGLVIDAIRRRLHPQAVPDITLTPGGSVREDLIRLFDRMRDNLQDECSGAAFLVLIMLARANPQVWRRYHDLVIEPRREACRRILRSGVERGELRADLDVERAMLMLSSTMITVCRLSAPHGDVGTSFTAGLVDDLLRGAAA